MTELNDLSTEALVDLCCQHSNPEVIREVLRIGDHRRPNRHQIRTAARRAGVPVQSISYWFGFGVGLDEDLVDLSSGGGVIAKMPSTPEAGYGLLVWMHTMRPEIRLSCHNKN